MMEEKLYRIQYNGCMHWEWCYDLLQRHGIWTEN